MEIPLLLVTKSWFLPAPWFYSPIEGTVKVLLFCIKSIDFQYYKLLCIGSFHIEILGLVYIELLKSHIFNSDLERELCVGKAKSQLHFNNFHLDWQRLSRIIASHWECGENISWDNNFDISHKSEHLHILIQQFHIYVHILRFQLIILRNMQKYVHCSNFHITKKGKHSKCPSIK